MERIARRSWLLGLAVLVGLPGAAPAQERQQHRRRDRPNGAMPRPPATPRVAATPPVPPPPAIDGPAPPSRIPGLEPAPVPGSAIQGPLADRQPRPQVLLGLPTAPELFQGESFGRADPAPDRRPMPGTEWLPSPGAQLRLPF